jgi:hypothetical protein
MATIIRRRKPEEPQPQRWVEIEQYPFLEEFIRGARVFRTKDEPLVYRIVNKARIRRHIVWPAVIGIANELSIRFHDYPVEFAIIDPDTGRAEPPWRPSLPDFRNHHVFKSNPDYVLMTTDWRIVE